MSHPETGRAPLLPIAGRSPLRHPIHRDLAGFGEFGTTVREGVFRAAMPAGGAVAVPTYEGEFWTSKQRTGHRLHEVSYRACFKPQLPGFFIERLTGDGDVVHDPFMGRGTTPLEAALRGRVPAGSDANPLSEVLLAPRLSPPTAAEVDERLDELQPMMAAAAARAGDRWPDGPDGDLGGVALDDLLTFYHPATLAQLTALRSDLLACEAEGPLDAADAWIRMIAVNRLTGHSPGFFSVYTLPPNQATSAGAQRKINHKRRQTPPPRDVLDLIRRRSSALLRGLGDDDRAALARVGPGTRLMTAPAAATPALADGSVALVVTSPPFLDIVHYRDDNWLRCWFCGIDPDAVELTMARSVSAWQHAMTLALRELHRVVRPGGFVAFEVGEVRGGTVRLDEAVLPCGIAAGFHPELVLINVQEFTKTANCWGVANNHKGTNSNRVVLLRK